MLIGRLLGSGAGAMFAEGNKGEPVVYSELGRICLSAAMVLCALRSRISKA